MIYMISFTLSQIICDILEQALNNLIKPLESGCLVLPSWDPLRRLSDIF